MLLSGVLFVLFLAGCWLYCLTDVALTPAREFRRLPKAAWIGIIAATFIVGAMAWLIGRRSWRARSLSELAELSDSHTALPAIASHGEPDFSWDTQWTAADDAIARHPAGRSRKPADCLPKGPDDDLDFLRLLDQRIRGNADAGE
jgi:hypothetical protein